MLLKYLKGYVKGNNHHTNICKKENTLILKKKGKKAKNNKIKRQKTFSLKPNVEMYTYKEQRSAKTVHYKRSSQ